MTMESGSTILPLDHVGISVWFQIAFRVADLPRAYEKAIMAGAQAVRPPFIAPDGKTPVAFIADPDGNLIELIERAG